MTAIFNHAFNNAHYAAIQLYLSRSNIKCSHLTWLPQNNFCFFIFLFVAFQLFSYKVSLTKITSCHSAPQAIHHPGKITWLKTHLALTISMRPVHREHQAGNLVLLTKLCPFGPLACTSKAQYLHITLHSKTQVNPLNISPNLRICP